MDEHGRYFQEHFAAGNVLLFGPVMATGGAFGLGVFEMDSEAEARKFGEGDPSVRAGMNKFEIHPMRVSAAPAKGQRRAEASVAGRSMISRGRGRIAAIFPEEYAFDSPEVKLCEK